MSEKIYGFSESDAGRVKKAVQKSEQVRPVAGWKNTPILAGGEEEENTSFFSDSWSGPFAVSIVTKENEEKKLFIKGGAVTANGVFFDKVADAELDLATGYVAVHLTLSNGGVWSVPNFKIIEFKDIDASHCPVALIELDADGEYVIHQGRIIQAQFIISKTCPLARL